MRWHDIHLEPGVYFVEVGVYDKNWTYAYDYHARSYPLVVRANPLSRYHTPEVGREFTTGHEWFVERREAAHGQR